jgi:2-oxoglutarate ferredoxin oxidoreductase subunit alpha
MIFFGTSTYAALEALDLMEAAGTPMDAMRLRATPFSEEVHDFIERHDVVYVVEQNRDAQMRSILINELEIDPFKLVPILNFDGMPITAEAIVKQVERRQQPVSNGMAYN